MERKKGIIRKIPAPSRGFIIVISVIAVVIVCATGFSIGHGLFREDENTPAFKENFSDPFGDSDRDIDIDTNFSPGFNQKDETAEEIIRLLDENKIYENIYVNGIDVSGLSVLEAEEKLMTALNKPLEEKRFTFVSGDLRASLSFRELGGFFDIKRAVARAYAFAREGEYSKRYELLLSLPENRQDFEADFLIDRVRLRSACESLRPCFETEPVLQEFSRIDGEFVCVPGKSGYELDVDRLVNVVAAMLESGNDENISVELTEIIPDENKCDFSKATSLIGSYRTPFTAGATGRNQNLRNAASKLDNTIIMPGEIFSTNVALGEMTLENGYAVGQALVNGLLVDDIGGGVCQISSTLYVAVLYAELEIVQRHNHSQKVSYVDWAYDATLATPTLDFKFKNDTEYPVTVESYISGSEVVVNIYGYESHGPSRKIMLESSLVSSDPPPAEQVTEDQELPYGTRIVDIPAKYGYTYNLYKLIYENGDLIERVQINTSVYRAMRASVRVGTGAIVPDITQEPSPEPPPEPLVETGTEAEPVYLPGTVPAVTDEPYDDQP